MNITPIKSKKDYEKTLIDIDTLSDSKPNTPEYDKLDILITLVDAYETKHFPIGSPDPIDAIKFTMNQLNLKRVDLGKWIGGRSRATEILDKKRKLTLDMIRTLNKNLNIPAEILMGDYRIKTAKRKEKV